MNQYELSKTKNNKNKKINSYQDNNNIFEDDVDLNLLEQGVETLRDQALLINEEVKLQDKILNDLKCDLTDVNSKITLTNINLNNLMKKIPINNNSIVYIFYFSLFCFFIIYLMKK